MKINLKNGFTLVEMAIVLAIMALILGTGLTLLSVQQDQQRASDSAAKLDETINALIGFAIANGRLPCPASSTSNGQESFCTGNLAAVCGAATLTVQAHGRCTNPYNGFLPAVTLGLSQTDAQGYAVDAWGMSQNRIRYAVYEGRITGGTANYSTFTASGEMAIATMTNISAASPLLSACANATGITATTCGTATTLSSNAVALIYSLGKNAPTGGTSVNEAANLNDDPVFVSHALATVDETGGYFDDQVTWISPYILFNRMVQAGKLP